MIIICPQCEKKFELDSNLIPDNGRTLQCGSCDEVWFFNPSIQQSIKKTKSEITIEDNIKSNVNKLEEKIEKKQKVIKKYPSKNNYKNDKKNYELTPYKSKSKFSLSKFLSYIIVIIITSVAIIIIIDTFKSPIYRFFPGIESIIFSLFEVLKDIKLFIKDLFF